MLNFSTPFSPWASSYWFIFSFHWFFPLLYCISFILVIKLEKLCTHLTKSKFNIFSLLENKIRILEYFNSQHCSSSIHVTFFFLSCIITTNWALLLLVNAYWYLPMYLTIFFSSFITLSFSFFWDSLLTF